MKPGYSKGMVARPLSPTLNLAVDILKRGGLVIAPTDTFYAIMGDVWSQRAVTRLVKFKSRDYGKPIPLIAGSKRITRSYVDDIPPIFDDLAREFWPGSLILVLKAARGLPAGITAGTGNVGIRVPVWCVAKELVRIMGRPLMVTGASFDPGTAPRSISEIPKGIRAGVDLILDGGWTPGYQPPTVLNLVPSSPELLREGIIGSRVTDFLNQMAWKAAISWSRHDISVIEV